jgi:type III restriction enzyme
LAGKYYQAAVDSLYQAISRGNAENKELPRIPKGYAGIGSTKYVDFHTTKKVYPANKCHLNLLVADTQKWEQGTGYALDKHAGVIKWVKNDHLGFYIPYRKQGISSRYIPDFIAELDMGLRLIIETKGRYIDDSDLKAKAAERWVNAVNRDGRFGFWHYVVVKEPSAMPNILDARSLAKWDVEGTFNLIAQDARSWVVERQKEGWLQEDFVESLIEFLNSEEFKRLSAK